MHGRFSIIGETCPGCTPNSKPMVLFQTKSEEHTDDEGFSQDYSKILFESLSNVSIDIFSDLTLTVFRS